MPWTPQFSPIPTAPLSILFCSSLRETFVSVWGKEPHLQNFCQHHSQLLLLCISHFSCCSAIFPSYFYGLLYFKSNAHGIKCTNIHIKCNLAAQKRCFTSWLQQFDSTNSLDVLFHYGLSDYPVSVFYLGSFLAYFILTTSKSFLSFWKLPTSQTLFTLSCTNLRRAVFRVIPDCWNKSWIIGSNIIQLLFTHNFNVRHPLSSIWLESFFFFLIMKKPVLFKWFLYFP